MYEILIATLITIGLLASAAYVVTWLPGVIRARRHHHTTLTALEITDFAALPALCFLVLTINALNVWESGVVMPATTGLMVQRVATLGLVVAVVLLRLFRWSTTYLGTPKDERRDGALEADRQRNGAS